jgi:hypothetical protein
MTIPLIEGDGTITRRPALGFPWGTLEGSGRRVAEIGRFSMLNTFFGRGQRIRLPDGATWRIKAVSWHRFVCPVVVDGEGVGLATSAPGHESYALNVPGMGLGLHAAEARPGRPRRWLLVHHEEEIGRLARNPYEFSLDRAVPLPVVLLGFSLASFGIMGEKDLVTKTTSWG